MAPERMAATLHAAGVALGLALPPAFGPGTERYLEELARWNRVARLTGYRTVVEQLHHLVLESLLLLAVLPEPASPLLDIGSGAGVPGLILKLARPEWTVTLIEANRRRANFLRHVTRQLALDQIQVEEGRAEDLAGEHRLRGRARTVTARAVGRLAVTRALAAPFLNAGGRLVVSVPSRGQRGTPGVRHAELALPAIGLRLQRGFLIIQAPELLAHVPRETGEGRGADPGRGQPEGWRRQDDNGG